jgi:uncharacterized protein YndB with AHSA1/START domain
MGARAEPRQGHELTITRIFDAPVALVFAAWTRPEHLVRWSCPRGFTIPFSDGDIRTGGWFKTCMRSPDGEDNWVSGVYREVVENRRLVFTHAWDDASGNRGHETLVTVTLEDAGGKTRLTLHQAFFLTESSRAGHNGGWSESLDKLAEFLAS